MGAALDLAVAAALVFAASLVVAGDSRSSVASVAARDTAASTVVAGGLALSLSDSMGAAGALAVAAVRDFTATQAGAESGPQGSSD